MMRVSPDRVRFLIKFDETLIFSRVAEARRDRSRLCRTDYADELLHAVMDRSWGSHRLREIADAAPITFTARQKPGLAPFLSGLRKSAGNRGSVHVMTVHPGFV
jgi:hypothetical protein